jgi:hypothetical protein
MKETEDLKLAAVAHITIMDAQNLVSELERLRCAYAKQLGALSLILKAFNDLYIEFNQKQQDRQWLYKQVAKAEREANLQRIPAWFWRMDKLLPVDDQIYRRTLWLLKEKPSIHLDDLWDALNETLSYSKLTIAPDELQKIIERAAHASTK